MRSLGSGVIQKVGTLSPGRKGVFSIFDLFDGVFRVCKDLGSSRFPAFNRRHTKSDWLRAHQTLERQAHIRLFFQFGIQPKAFRVIGI